MRKLSLIGTLCPTPIAGPATAKPARTVPLLLALLLFGGFALVARPSVAQPAEAQAAGAQAAGDQAAGDQAGAVAYPLNVDVGPGGAVTVVDLDLPGLWRLGDPGQPPELFFRGPVKMRTPMNRPRCVLALEDGSVLVGDSASRDIYRLTADTDPAQLKGLTDGYIGIPMCLALDPDGQTLYVGDAERRSLFRVDLQGGKPELVASVNARGLSFDAAGRLWALTPDDAAIVTVDSEGKVTPLVTGRPFQYPGGLVHVDDWAYVTDGYGKAIWRVDAQGQTSKWFEGGPLKHPVGIATGDQALLVADPHSKQIFRFPLTEKPTAEPLLP